jgi:putative membrane protein
MNKKNALVLVLSGVLLSSVCLNASSLAQTVETPQSTQQNAGVFTPADREFATKAAQGNLAEIQVGQLALKRSTNPQVHSLASQLIQDHTKANTDLARIAENLNLPLPQETDPKHKALYNELSELSGTAFDRMFLTSMYQDHVATIALFQQEAQAGGNRELKQYATTYLPGLTHHRDMTVAAARHMNIDVASAPPLIPSEQPAAYQPTHVSPVRGLW